MAKAPKSSGSLPWTSPLLARANELWDAYTTIKCGVVNTPPRLIRASGEWDSAAFQRWWKKVAREYTAAQRILLEYLKIMPNDPEGWEELAHVYDILDRPRAAMKAAKQSLALERRASTLMLLADLCVQIGDTKAAHRYVRDPLVKRSRELYVRSKRKDVMKDLTARA